MTEIQRCKRCERDLPRTKEHWYFLSSGRISLPCRECRLEMNREYQSRPETKAHLAAYRAAYFAIPGKLEQRKATMRAYYLRRKAEKFAARLERER